MNFFQEFRTETKLLLVVALAAVTLAVGGVLLLKVGLGPSSPTPIEEQQESEEDLDSSTMPRDQAELDFAGWQTYRNDEFGFEVKYPENFVNKEYPSGIRSSEVFGIQFVDQKWEEGHYPSLTISVIETKLSPREWLEKYSDPVSESSPGDIPEPAVGYRNAQDTIVNGRIALNVEFIAASDISNSTLIQGESNRLYRIDAISSGLGDFPQEAYSQILSTFRFVNSEIVVVDKKDVWFADTLSGEVVLSSKDAVVNTTRSEELSCAYPTVDLKRYRGNFELGFEGKSLDLGQMEFVGIYAEFEVLSFPGGITFLVISQSAGCNGRTYQMVGYTNNGLSIIPFEKEGKKSIDIYGYGLNIEETLLTSSFYSQGDGLVHKEYYSWNPNEDKFVFVKEETQPL